MSNAVTENLLSVKFGQNVLPLAQRIINLLLIIKLFKSAANTDPDL